MSIKNFNASVGGALLMLFMALGIFVVTGTTAQAQYPQYPYGRDGQYGRDRDDRDRDRDYRRGRDVYRIAQDRGYQDGLDTGTDDARRGQSFNPERSHYYKNATYGYNSSFGSKNAYKRAYRDGFERGYSDGYRRYGGYNRGGYHRRDGRWFPFQ